MKIYSKLTSSAVAAGFLLTAASSLPAANLITNGDFETAVTGTEVPSWTESGNNSTVVTSTSPFGGGQMLWMDDVTINNSDPNVSQSFTPVGATDTLYVQFDYLYKGDTGSNQAVKLYGADFVTNEGVLLHLTQNGANYPTGREASGNSNLNMTGATLSADTWYRYTITVNADKTWDFRAQSIANTSLDYDHAGTGGLDFADPATTTTASLSNIAFFYNTTNQGDDYYIDNVLVTSNAADLNFAVVPEPGTFALLAGVTGLVFIMLRRRRD